MPHPNGSHPNGRQCCEIVVVAASAGGVETLTQLVAGLPEGLRAAVFVVLHLPESRPSMLPDILSRKGVLPAQAAVDGAPIEPGRIYVAVPGRHLTILPGKMQLSSGPRENGHRPSADVLFSTAAKAYGGRVAGVVLSGADDDGAAGLAAIKRQGGVAIAQDPAEAMYPRMPQSALNSVPVDYCLPVREIARRIGQLAATQPPAERPNSVEEGAVHQPTEERYQDRQPSAYTCPECHGTLWEVDEGELMRFRCRVGHAYSADHLLSGQADNLEAALWMALRTLEERAQLSGDMAKRASKSNLSRAAKRFQEAHDEAEHAAGTLRELLLDGSLGAAGAEHTAEPEASALV